MARCNPKLGHAFELARLGADAWMVIGLRLTKLAAGGPAAAFEAQRVVMEKATAALEAQFAAGMALALGPPITRPAARHSPAIAAASAPIGGG